MDAFPVNDKIVEQVRKHFQVNHESIENDVEILREWLKKQPHLPQQLPYDNFLEKVLLGRKFNVQRSKETIENLFTLKTYYNDIYQPFFVDEYPRTSKTIILSLPLPKLMPGLERIIMFVSKPENPLVVEHFYQTIIGLTYLLQKYDYCLGYYLVIDWKNISFDVLNSVPLINLYKVLNMILKGFPVRVLGIEVLNMKPFAQFFFNLIKTIGPKIGERIRFHSSLDSLYNIIPKEYLPTEYGGNNDSVVELAEKLDDMYINEKNNLREFAEVTTKEELRIGEIKDIEKFGVDGTFKKLNID